MKKHLTGPYLYAALSFLFLYAGWSSWFSFFQIWLTDPVGGLGLNGKQVGTIFSFNGLAVMFTLLTYGAVQDRIGLRRNLLFFISIMATLIGPFGVLIYRPLLEGNFYIGVLLGAIFFAVSYSAPASFSEAYFNRFARHHKFEFGRARMFGSFGFACGVIAMGALYPLNPDIIFWAASVMGVMLLLTQIFGTKAPQEASKEVLQEISAEVPQEALVDTAVSVESAEQVKTSLWQDFQEVVRNRKLWVLSAWVVLVWTMFSIFDSQMFPNFFASLFATPETGQRAYSALVFTYVIIETILMSLVPILVRKIGAKKAMLLGSALILTMIAGAGIFDLIPLIVAARLLHGLTVPLMVLGALHYVNLHFDPARSASVYLISFYIAAQVAIMVIATPLGMLRDAYGYQAAFLVMALASVTGIILAALLLERDADAINEL
ncbi:MAG: oligosaccharide MFS transporter [Arcanobacterium sp.]|nr:oligosaccharide MFS transporter [Arcanobacterium sp.]